MNASPLLAVAAISSLVCLLLTVRKASGAHPGWICGRVADVLMLPVVGAYLLMLVAGGWFFVAVDLCASIAFPPPGKPRPQPPLPPRSPAGPPLPSMT